VQRRPVAVLTFLAFTTVLASCSGVHQLAGIFQDLRKLQLDLAKALGYDQIQVQLINGDSLQIGVLNSPWKELPADQKNSKALAIARLAYKGYRSRSALRSVTVNFAVHRSYLGVFDYDSRDPFEFEISQLTSESLAPIDEPLQ
jgi:hypothetical protein